MSETFQCVTCGHSYPAHGFYRRKSVLEQDCKTCSRARNGLPPARWMARRVKNDGLVQSESAFEANCARLDYNELVRRQGGVCKICKTIGGTKLHIDHDHVTNEIRGLLCFNCNSAIGKLSDSVEILRSAIAYLEDTNRQIPYRKPSA